MKKEIVNKGVYTYIEVEEFIANDGKRFNSEESCLKHERNLLLIEDFKKKYSYKETIYGDIFKAMCPSYSYYDDTYAIMLNIPLEKNDEFYNLFYKVFGHYFHNYDIRKDFEGEVILIEFYEERPNGGSYGFEVCTKKEVLEFLDQVKEEIIKL